MGKFCFYALLLSLGMVFFAQSARAEHQIFWNGKEINGWVCNGHELRPKIGANSSNTWIFTGSEIRPKTGATSSNTWIFNGSELRPKVGANSSNTWVLSGGKFRPKAGANSSNTWNVGNAPILVITGAAVLHLF